LQRLQIALGLPKSLRLYAHCTDFLKAGSRQLPYMVGGCRKETVMIYFKVLFWVMVRVSKKNLEQLRIADSLTETAAGCLLKTNVEVIAVAACLVMVMYW
jgi:hypothetical protein